MSGELPRWWSDKANRKKQNRRSAAQEREYAVARGGRVQPGSGSSPRAPQDVKLPLDENEEGYLVQLKYTDDKGFRLDANEWQRLRSDAHRTGREPLLIIDFERFGIRLRVSEEDEAD